MSDLTDHLVAAVCGQTLDYVRKIAAVYRGNMVGESALIRAAGFDIPEASLDRLASIASAQLIESGSYLFHKGDPCNALHIIVDGKLQVVSTSIEGQDLVFGEFGSGGVIGELTVLDGADRSASVRAIKPTQLLTIARRDLLDLARQDPEVAIGIAKLCAQRALRLSLWAEAASFSDTVGRLASMLIRLADNESPGGSLDTKVRLRVTQQSLADQLGIRRESINKALRTLEGEGLVALGRGSITLLDPEKLSGRTTV